MTFSLAQRGLFEPPAKTGGFEAGESRSKPGEKSWVSCLPTSRALVVVANHPPVVPNQQEPYQEEGGYKYQHDDSDQLVRNHPKANAARKRRSRGAVGQFHSGGVTAE